MRKNADNNYKSAKTGIPKASFRHAHHKHKFPTHPKLQDTTTPPLPPLGRKTLPHTKQSGNEFPHKIRVQRMSPALSLSLSLFVHLLCAATINLAFIFTFLPSCPVPVLVLSAPLFFWIPPLKRPPDNIVVCPCPSVTPFSMQNATWKLEKLLPCWK